MKLERDYLFCKALNSFVKPRGAIEIDVGSKVELTALRMEKTFEGELSLTAKEGEQTTIFSGTGKQHQLDLEPLSLIIAQLNERFGTDWAPEDRFFYDAVAEKLANRTDMQQKAAANDEENFGLVLGDEFMKGVVAQLNTSEDMAIKFIDDKGLQQAVLEAYLPLIYGKAKVANQEHCPVGDLLGSDKESQTLEYKATLRTHAHSGEVYKPLETATLKTLAAFLNSPLGGTLLIGVDDRGNVTGLASDYESLHKDGKHDRDRFELHLGQMLVNGIGEAAAANATTQIHTVEGHDLCRIHVKPCVFPVDATVIVDRKGNLEKKQAFYVRINNGTREITDSKERERYVSMRWASSHSAIHER